MKLTISLLTHNSASYIPACLKSIAEQTFTDFQLVCRDNRSEDETVATVQRVAPDARVVIEAENRGFSAGHNATIRETQSAYVCVLNHDLVLEPRYLEACIAFLDAHPSVGSVSGLLIRVSALTDRPDPGIIDASGIAILRTGRAVLVDAGKPGQSVLRTKRMFGVPATAAVYRRAALDDVAINSEVFDEDFFMYKEDVDLAMRLALRGWEAFVIPAARAYHIRSTDYRILRRSSAWINRLSYRNHWFVLIKSLPSSFWIRNGIFIISFELAKFIYLLFREPSTLTVLSDVLKFRKKMFVKRRNIMSRAALSTERFYA